VYHGRSSISINRQLFLSLYDSPLILDLINALPANANLQTCTAGSNLPEKPNLPSRQDTFKTPLHPS
jgi:hypothetical protein